MHGLAFTKGHGTENDFVLVPDPEGRHDLTPDEVRALADRRAGVGGDGVINHLELHELGLDGLHLLHDLDLLVLEHRDAAAERVDLLLEVLQLASPTTRRSGPSPVRPLGSWTTATPTAR